MGVRPASGFAELEGREGPEEEGAIGAELGGKDDLACGGGGGGLTDRCAVPFMFEFVFGLEGPAELGRCGEVVALGGGGGNIGLVPGELAGGLAVLVFALVFVVALIFVSETEIEADPELYNILSNSLFPPNSPLTILSVTTTSNPQPLPSPPPALINPSKPPPSENLERSKSYSLTSLPFINVDPAEGSEIAHDKKPFPAH